MPAGSFYGEFLSTVGMEFEGIGLDKDFVGSTVQSYMINHYPSVARKISFTYDASTQFKVSAVSLDGNIVWISDHTKEANIDYFQHNKMDAKVMGYEIITNPLTIPELESLVYPLVTTLQYFGDFISDRAAVHYHVGFANNLHLLQNLLAIGLYVDPVLFRLGGMGRTFRGRINNSAYARPLLNSIAAYTQNDSSKNRYVRAINPIAALKAESMEQFWASFGVKYATISSHGKYHPCRYSGINFYSIPQHGTIEWRHFNQTHDTYLMMAIGKFLRGITELAVYINKRELAGLSIVPSDDEISVSDGVQILSHLYELCKGKEFENLPTDEEMGDICNVFTQSHFESISKTPVLTHLTSENANVISVEVARKGHLEFLDKVLPHNHVDIHNIGYISIYDELNLKNPPKNISEEEPEFEEEEM